MALRIAPLVLCLLAAPALAETVVPQSQAQISLSFAPVVTAAAPAVVNIYVTQMVSQDFSPFANDPFFSQFFGTQIPQAENSLGSGVILRPDGIVVSNYHVVGQATDIRVVLADRREFSAHVLLADRAADLAVIQLDGATGLPALDLSDSDQVSVGDLVLAIGDPFGVGQTVTSGIVSGLARSGATLADNTGYLIQTDAPINPGNSGGALVDMQGRLLGINTSILTRSGGSNGIGFAIPSNLVRVYVDQALAGNRALVRPWSGLALQGIDAAMAGTIGLEVPHGVLVSDLDPASPFASAGLQHGDVIEAVDGHPVDSPAEFGYRLTLAGLQSRPELTIWRAGKAIGVSAVVGAAPDMPPRNAVTIATDNALGGLSLSQINPAVAAEMGLPAELRGVVVTGVEGNAIVTQMQRGDILRQINGQDIVQPSDAVALSARNDPGWDIRFDREGQRLRIRIRQR